MKIPYIISPFPWITNHEKDIILIGLNDIGTAPPTIPKRPSDLDRDDSISCFVERARSLFHK
jgi:hypothetical protein